MKPSKILLFLIASFTLVMAVAYLIPEKRVRITSFLTLRIPDQRNFLPQKTIKYKDISKIINLNQEQHTELAEDTSVSTFMSDTMSMDDTVDISSELSKDTIKASKTQEQPKPNRIQLPVNQKDILEGFYASLKNESKNNLIRVIHYGDSQIEGDRITSYLRNELQKKFGGNGIGLFCPVPIQGTHTSLHQINSGSWYRYTIKSIENNNIYHRKLGVLMSFGRFSPAMKPLHKTYTASISLAKSPITYSRNRIIENLEILYSNNSKPFVIEVVTKNKLLDADIVPPTSSLQSLSWNLPVNTKEVSLSFKGDDSPDIYALMANSKSGVAVDNVPLRGSSGTDFTRTNIPFYRDMFAKLNIKLIILQFGVNLVPYIKDDYSYYETRLYKQLKFLKSLDKDIGIIVIGVSDMSQNIEGVYQSYPNIELIRDAQKRAAFKAGCAFWDMYEAMGGQNSMPSWVSAEPTLARTDYTHFTYKGSVVIAKMFYDALMEEYNQYINNHKNAY